MSNQLYTEIETSLETAKELGLNEAEWEQILKYLNRKPTYTELGVYSVMWSEHCSYKNSILELKKLPRKGGRLLVEAGEENAGLIDIGDGYAIAFKIESHNHPSAIEPFQGAATGVGGILRDIFTMGARPIAALNSLRFGELNNERTKFLLNGVVEGIAHYGNCFGVPTVGGEIYFDDCYHDNPLVNAMAVGIVKIGKTASAAAHGPGNPVIIIGSSTGRDGIHGASLLASREFDEKTEDMRPTVQVGDPFAEKLLLEATLEMIDAEVIVGIQDMGAAGISCSTSEMSARTDVGMNVDLDKVPLREHDMSAYEIMLSESQERMLAIVKEEDLEKAKAIADKWDVPFTQIGNVTGDGHVHIYRNGEKVCELIADTLVLGGGAPVNERPFSRPKYLDEVNNLNISELPHKMSNLEAFYALLTSPNIASKRWVFEQYDSQVRTNTVSIKGDAAVLRLKEVPGKGIALTTDCNSRYVYLNPHRGGMIAVAEAARNVVCTGAKPLAITNCLNFGNPYNPEVFWQFKEALRGMGDACRKFDTPVTGGNVSFHNESRDKAVFPTPTIGMLGLIEDINKVIPSGFQHDGDYVYLLGLNREELGGSEYLKVVHNLIAGDAPVLDLDMEDRLHNLILELNTHSLVNSAHDVSEGGIAICLAEKAIFSDNNLGCKIFIDGEVTAAKLFGQSQSMIVVSIKPQNEQIFEDYCTKFKIPATRLGAVSNESFEINSLIKTDTAELREKYEGAIPKLMSKPVRS